MAAAFAQLFLMDLAFLAICILVVAPLAVYKRAAWAVLKRNFIGYFSNPTGYVFLCLFVLLTSFSAFWPHEFFSANLANLDQLNQFLPYIMLVFIPAITMSIWSEERRQGTDELLLTLPADDFDIVIGKYLAAGAIFTASLLFSQFSNYIVLAWLTSGDLDTGLFFATYFGYWMVGLAMLSLGMVASFLTSNMTVGFILGAVFNAPLAFAAGADKIVIQMGLAQQLSFWSLSEQLEPFGRGVISFGSVVYFLLLIAVGLYLSMILIGSRHWSGKQGNWMVFHYAARACSLVVTLIASVVLFSNLGLLRADVSEGQISSLSPKTKEMIRELRPEHPIVIEAFIGAQMPEQYVQTKYNLISLLKEFDAKSADIDVRLHEDLETFSEDAATAQERFGISPVRVRTRTRGTFKDEDVILGAAFTCGLEKVVVPFFDYGVPVEYELIRSIGTVAHGERKKLGVVRTDAQMFGGFSFAGGMPQQIPRQEIVQELEKQYDVEEVDPTQPIRTERVLAEVSTTDPGVTREQIETWAGELGKGQLPGELSERLKRIGYRFSDDLEITVQKEGESWVLLDRKGLRRYVARKESSTSAPAKTNENAGSEKKDNTQPANAAAEKTDGEKAKAESADGLQKKALAATDKLSLRVYGNYYDVLLAVQPSSLGPQEMQNFVAALRNGQPAAIFEDPLPMLFGTAPGTGEPKQAPGGMFGGGGPQPKGDIRELWDLLGLNPPGEPGFQGSFNPDLAWQRYNPYPKLRRIEQINDLWVFASNQAPGAAEAFNPQDPVTARLSEVLLPAPGILEKKEGSKLEFSKLVTTTQEINTAGRIRYQQVRDNMNDLRRLAAAQGRGSGEQILAARVQGLMDTAATGSEAADAEKPAAEQRPLNVIYVADIDCMISAFLRIRARPDEDEEIDWHFENVNFLLNIIDSLSGDDQYVDIRMRKPYHATLRQIEAQAVAARNNEWLQREEYEDKYKKEIDSLADEKVKSLKAYEDRVKDLKKKMESGEEVSLQDRLAVETARDMQEQKIDQKQQVTKQQMERELNTRIEQIRRESDLRIQEVQNWYKFWAVVIPPIPPLLVGIVVFVQRRLREREGVSKSRLR